MALVTVAIWWESLEQDSTKTAKYLLPLLAFGVPYMITAVALATIPSIDRYLISNSLGLTVLGVYAVGYKFSAIMRLPILGFRTAWGPFAYAIYKEENAERTYRFVFIGYTLAVTCIAIGISVFSQQLVALLASAKYSLNRWASTYSNRA